VSPLLNETLFGYEYLVAVGCTKQVACTTGRCCLCKDHFKCRDRCMQCDGRYGTRSDQIMCRQQQPVDELGEVQLQDGVYSMPAWGEAPPGEDAPALDIMKTGTIIDTQVLPFKKGFVTFGRHKAVDVMVEHPSASRMHAVLQFRGREAFLADCSSTHGTFLNRQILEARKYYAVHVGAQFRLGQSTRSYIFVAPEVRSEFIF
jgi:hypothetical protein